MGVLLARRRCEEVGPLTRDRLTIEWQHIQGAKGTCRRCTETGRALVVDGTTHEILDPELVRRAVEAAVGEA